MPAPPLHLTDDLELDLTDPSTVDIRYRGDLHLATTFGRELGVVLVDGDLTLDVPHVGGTCIAGGRLRVDGDVDGNRLSARELHLGGGTIRARALSASERIVIGPARLKVDVIIAPFIEIHPEARGRVTLIESRNERGPTQVKGGFTLSEYEELFGEARQFLTDRGVGTLDDLADPPPELQAHPALDDIEELSPDAIDHLEELEDVEPEDGDIVDLHADALSPVDDDTDLVEVDPEPLDDDTDLVEVDPEPLDDDTDLVEVDPEPLDDDPDAVGTMSPDPLLAPPASDLVPDDLEDEDAGIIEEVQRARPTGRTPTGTPPRPPPSLDRATEVWFAKIDRVLDRLSAAYADTSDPPSSLAELEALVAARRPEELTRGLPPLWGQVWRHHRQTRAPLSPRVAHGFRVLHDLVQVGPDR
jgi:hypothetical protein